VSLSELGRDWVSSREGLATRCVSITYRVVELRFIELRLALARSYSSLQLGNPALVVSHTLVVATLLYHGRCRSHRSRVQYSYPPPSELWLERRWNLTIKSHVSLQSQTLNLRVRRVYACLSPQLSRQSQQSALTLATEHDHGMPDDC
jgi:hypothetical protein